MKKIAIVSPMILPVPAVNGGAVEELITRIIDANEKNPKYFIDLYTISDDKLELESLKDKYKYTNILTVKYSPIYQFLDRIIDKINRQRCARSTFRIIDSIICGRLYDKDYDQIIIENISSIYRRLQEKCDCKKISFHIHNNVDMYRCVSDLKLMMKNDVEIWAVSDFMKRQITAYVPNIRCSVFTNTVDRERFKPCNDKEVNEGFTFLYSGRIIPEKGVLELVEAFNDICGKIKDIKLVITGKPLFEMKKVTEYYRLVYGRANNNENIVFTGFVEPINMQRVYSMADVVVIPSIWEEPFGLVALEAMSCAKPIITTTRGALGDLVGDKCSLKLNIDHDIEENSIEDDTSNKNMVEKLKIAMLEIYNDRKLVELMSREALRWMDENSQFNNDNYFQEFCRLLN